MLVMPPTLASDFAGCGKSSCYAHEQASEDCSPLYRTDEFRMFCFKVLPCSKRFVHDWTVCPFAHPGEKAKRRDPRNFSYTGVACPDMKKCQRGDSCPYAHNVFEYWMHPSRYRTQLCNDGIGCKRKVCFFAHTLDELRVSNVKLLPSDLSTDAGGFELDPFRPANRSSPKTGAAGGASAAAPGTEALVEALRVQQQQQQHAKKAAAALQRTASRGLAAELQQLQALQQLQTVLAGSQGLGPMQQQVPMESLMGTLMAQLRLGASPGQQPGPQPLGGGAGSGSLLDAVVQQAVQQALANNAAQQAATAMMLFQQQQQQQQAVAAAQQQQQNQHAAQAHALLEHLLQQQAAAHAAHQAAHVHQGNSGPPQPSAQAMQAALAMLQQQQAQQAGHMGGMAYGGPHAAGPMQGPMGTEQLQQAHMSAPPPHMTAVGRSSPQNGSLTASVRSSSNGMAATGSLGPTSSNGSGALTPGAGAATEPIAVASAPSPPRSLAAPSPVGSPPGETPLSAAISGNAAAAALSAAATAASYYSQEASRSSFESYRSSEVELGIQLASGHHSSGPNSSGGARGSLDLVHQPQQHSKFMQDMYTAPGSAAEETLRMQEARHRQLLMAAAVHAANGGMSAGGAGAQERLAEQVAMAACAAGQQYAGPPFGM